MGSLYDSDLVAWSAEQARVIRDAARQRGDAPIVPAIIAKQAETERALVRDTFADCGETPLQPLEAVTFDEGTILGDWLPDRDR